MPNLRLVKNSTGTQDNGSIRLTIKDIPLGDIRIKENVRKNYAGIEELAESIRQHGLLQPITVYADGDSYVVKTGHRRFKASQLLYQKEPDKFHSVRCIISDADNLSVIQLVENVQREDLSQLDLFTALSALREQGMTMKQIANAMGKSEDYIKHLFIGINEIQHDESLLELVSGAGTTIIDVKETKGIDKKERLEVLENRGKGTISREEMRTKVRELKKSATPSKQGNKEPAPESIKYWVSSDDLTIKLTFSDIKLAKKVEPLIKKLFRESKIKILNFYV
ncbi:chromosome partitioning protein ParB [Spirochaetia bacterium]|nr:chromosome partitioning protein ParB [Spirochaetia bacterium]